MTEIIGISKAGVNVGTATNPNDFIFHSSYNTFKILASGTVSHTIPANTTDETFNIAHGQSIIPFAFAFIKWSNGYVTPANGGKPADSTNIVNMQFGVNATNLVFDLRNLTAADEAITVSYYITEVPL